MPGVCAFPKVQRLSLIGRGSETRGDTRVDGLRGVISLLVPERRFKLKSWSPSGIKRWDQDSDPVQYRTVLYGIVRASIDQAELTRAMGESSVCIGWDGNLIFFSNIFFYLVLVDRNRSRQAKEAAIITFWAFSPCCD